MSNYNDDDFVYVNPKTREVLGLVKWSKDGEAIKMEMEEEIEQEGKPKGKIRKKSKKSYYPWGTYRTMKKIYKLEGKQKEENASRPFDEALTKAVNETFWD